MENSHLSSFLSVDRISASAIMKNWKMAAILLISIIQKNFKLPTSKVWVSGFLSVDGNRISVLAIMKKLKNGCHFININHMEKFQTTDPPKFGSPVFRVSTETEYQYRPLWKNWKMATILLISIVQKNFQLPTPQSLGLQFSKCQRKWNISIGHYEKIEKWLPFN